MKNSLQLTLVVVFVFFIGFNLTNNKDTGEIQPINNIKHIKINGVSLAVELALTPQAKEQGLSGRDILKEGEGMLFVFDHPGKYPFWMKNMNFPIDIIWIGEDLKIVYIKKNATPETYPTTFASSQNAQYVLEVISGFGDKNNLKEGDRVLFF